MKLKSIDEILDFAIEKEEDAAQFYTELAGKMKSDHIKNVFLGFAEEEKGHKRKLESVKSGKRMISAEKKVLDLKIGDHLVDIALDSNLDYQEALIVAMKAEKAAYKLYMELAGSTDDAEVQNLFIALANEEAKHKLRFEIEYDDAILTEN